LLQDNNHIETANKYIESSDFYSPKLRRIYECILDFINKNERADIISVGEKFGASDITYLSMNAPSDIDFYCKKVRELSIRRKIKSLGASLMQSSEDLSKDVSEIIEEVEGIDELAENKAWEYKRIAEYYPEALEELEKIHMDGMVGISTGYRSLDRFRGLVNSELMIIGARASIGKTTLALNMAERVARVHSVGFMSLEMGGKLLLMRLLNGSSSSKDLPIFVYDQPNAKILNLKANAKRMKRKDKIKVLFIDYLNLIRTAKTLPRWEEVGYISSELKSLARELDLPVVALAQVNRDAEGKPPSLANLRESGSIEQDADVVVFLHRKRESSDSEIIYAKNRNGPTGTTSLNFIPEKTQFEESEF
jgi:replicative DNA helicase